eukprot:TRINITY_DN15024_c0_g3_i2.p1 TRINITY_DN15024_c0_g3~~TRINITY_DN15024_c0_g3_i2.p1  ORF type:complete len:704 (+),score=158.06 TRINITY_DN15024_c0_g3_i2:75-2114(+)
MMTSMDAEIAKDAKAKLDKEAEKAKPQGRRQSSPNARRQSSPNAKEAEKATKEDAAKRKVAFGGASSEPLRPVAFGLGEAPLRKIVEDCNTKLRNSIRDDLRMLMQAVGSDRGTAASLFPPLPIESQVSAMPPSALRRKTVLRSSASPEIVEMLGGEAEDEKQKRGAALAAAKRPSLKDDSSRELNVAMNPAEELTMSLLAPEAQAPEANGSSPEDTNTEDAGTASLTPSDVTTAPASTNSVESRPVSKRVSVKLLGGKQEKLQGYSTDEADNTSWSSMFSSLVSSRVWEGVVAGLIMLNAMWIGTCIEVQCRRYPASMPHGYEIVDGAFCVVFVLEIVFRVLASGGLAAYFCSKTEWAWNMFDFVVVSISVVDYGFSFDQLANLSGARLLRLLRIVRFIRFVRVVRVFRLIEELRTVVSSAISSLKALVWTLMLMFLMIYVVALCMTQVFLESRPTASDDSYIELWWGSLFRTLLTLFQCITSGTTWDQLLRPLIEDLGPLAGFGFILYIAFCVFALLNVITGVFVEKALVNAEHDKVEFLRDRICDAFRRIISVDDGTSITAEKFEEMVNTEEIQEYFKAIDVDTGDSNTIFQILDADKSGSIDVVEFITGCMRLRGPAQALHLEMLMFECKTREEVIISVADRIGRQVETLLAKTEGFMQARQPAMAIENAAPTAD